MFFRAVWNRCAVNVQSLCLPISDEEALCILEELGFVMIEVDLVALARERIGCTTYRLGARLRESPQIVDCSAFTKWLYGKKGVWLPRRSIQQREMGESVPFDCLAPGDLVFSSGFRGFYHSNPKDGVGHVGMVTGTETVIHAMDRWNHVVESSFSDFIDDCEYRGAKRIIPRGLKVLTLKVPEDLDVESSDDLRWIVLQAIGRRKDTE